MIIGNLKIARNNKPFIVTPKFSLIAIEVKGIIVEFEVRPVKGVKKIIKVKDHNLLAAWKLLENHCEKL
jgi:hypothetical protein